MIFRRETTDVSISPLEILPLNTRSSLLYIPGRSYSRDRKIPFHANALFRRELHPRIPFYMYLSARNVRSTARPESRRFPRRVSLIKVRIIGRRARLYLCLISHRSRPDARAHTLRSPLQRVLRCRPSRHAIGNVAVSPSPRKGTDEVEEARTTE